jgi:hypothetical protein
MMNILAQFCMAQVGFGPVGEIRMLTPGSGATQNLYRDKIYDANLHHLISKAEAACVTGRNDVILVSPDSHPWKGDTHIGGEVLTWDKTSTHLIGMSPTSLAGYNRARFSHAGYAMANFMTVSGDDNMFKNLRFMHGSATGGAADVTALTVSGHGNRFENVAFAGPNNAAQAAAAGYKGLVLSGSHNYFKGCMFGSVNDVSRTGASAILKLATTCGAWNIFENCIFRSRCDAATPYFINDATTAVVVDYTAIFLNCQFLNQGTELTLGITKAANTARKLYFDNRCTFAGVADIVTNGREGEVLWGSAGATPDLAAISDALTLGLARPVNHTA